MSDYDVEAVDRLPFNTADKADRYRTDRFGGAVGLNWYTTDPTLQFTLAYYLPPDHRCPSRRHIWPGWAS